jgi:hypothetical protein
VGAQAPQQGAEAGVSLVLPGVHIHHPEPILVNVG